MSLLKDGTGHNSVSLPFVCHAPTSKTPTILVVEDEPLIVMDVSMALENSGAHVTSTNSVKHAKLLVEHDGLSAAILDHALLDGDSSSLAHGSQSVMSRTLFTAGSKQSTAPQGCFTPQQARDPGAVWPMMEALIRDHKS